MARRNYNRGYNRTVRMRPNYNWCPFPSARVTVAGAANTIYLLGTFPMGIGEDVQTTLERMRGEIVIDPTVSAGVGVMYAWIAPQVIFEGVSAGTAVTVPNPLEAGDTDDFPMVQPMCVTNSSAQAFTVDSKARRKLNKDDVIGVFIAMGANSFGSTQVYPVLRALCALRK